jgi:hypothetical protein
LAFIRRQKQIPAYSTFQTWIDVYALVYPNAYRFSWRLGGSVMVFALLGGLGALGGSITALDLLGG